MGSAAGYESQALEQIGLRGDTTYFSFRLAKEANSGDLAHGYVRVAIAQERALFQAREALNRRDPAWFEYAYDLGTGSAQRAQLVFHHGGNTPEGLFFTC